jgi:hypothetical protein
MLKLEKFNVRIVRKGDRFGRNDCLVHDDDRPMVEFYDHRYDHSDFKGRGQFVSRYFVCTLLEGENRGLCLDGGNRNEWTVSADGMAIVRAYINSQEQTA